MPLSKGYGSGEETRYDIKMKCPECNKILKLDEPVIIYGPNPRVESESSSDMMVETPFQLYCNRHNFQYVGCVQSGGNDTSFIIQPLEDYWYFWVKELE